MRSSLVLVSPVTKYHYTYNETVALLPDEYRKLLAKDRRSNEDTAEALLDWTMKQGRYWLDISTILVFQFILWRTYRYYKKAELISRSQFLEGVWDSKDDTSNCARVTTSTHTLYKALKTLEDTGYIRQTAIKINGADAVSLFEIDCKRVLDNTVVKGDIVPRLRESKKSKGQVIGFPTENEPFLRPRRECTSALPPVVHKCTTEGKPKTSKPKEEETKKTSCSVPRNEVHPVSAIDCKSKIEGVVAKATARVTRLRNVKVERAALDAMISLSDLNATWKQAMISAYGSCTVAGLTVKEYGMFRRTVKTHTLDCSWKEFFTWAISNWRQINKESLALSEYRKKKSGEWSLKDEQTTFLGTKAPDLFMLVKNYGKLLKRFSQKGLEGRGVASEDTEEVKALKAKLEATTRQETVNRQLLDKALRAKQAVPATPRPPPRIVATVNPEHDQFFQGDDDDMLPVWK